MPKDNMNWNDLPHEARLGDEPIEEAYRDEMQTLAHALDEYFNGEVRGTDRKTGFVLMVFPFGDEAGRCNYISNGSDRRDVVVLMKEMIRRFEGAPDVTGHA